MTIKQAITYRNKSESEQITGIAKILLIGIISVNKNGMQSSWNNEGISLLRPTSCLCSLLLLWNSFNYEHVKIFEKLDKLKFMLSYSTFLKGFIIFITRWENVRNSLTRSSRLISDTHQIIYTMMTQEYRLKACELV